MGNDAVIEAKFPSYERLDGAAPVFYPPEMHEGAEEARRLLDTGIEALSEVLEVEPPELEALLVAESDWNWAPRESLRAYPYGLPYFTRSVQPPALVLPEDITTDITPRTEATAPLVLWHELAHAFLLREEIVKTPTWLGEFVPQASAVVVAHRAGQPLAEHLAEIEREPGFTIRKMKGPADAGRQMAFQNLLLSLGAAALGQFGEGFLRRLVHSLWDETKIVDEARASELLAGSLGPDGREWLESRPEF